ncbi:MAG: hypothetical protein KUG78_05475 [Kangiellaceae bacterium]|nr:hypothetical protein [Kangiellaceae bacterium]
MVNLSENNKSRLGSLLIRKRQLTESQLAQALDFQKEHDLKLGEALEQLGFINTYQLRTTLWKQQILRVVAATIALICSPFNTVSAGEHKSIAPQTTIDSNTQISNDLFQSIKYTANLNFSMDEREQKSKDFYFSGNHEHLFSLKKDFSDLTGIQFSLFSATESQFKDSYTYQFDPQISLFSFQHKPSKSNYHPKTIGAGLDRASDTIPVVFMLTLKGRCLYENSGKQIKMWSLDRAKKGVQRKAELMFSITKQF